MKSSRTATLASAAAALLAIYEFVVIALDIDSLPTITEFLEDGPEVVELAVFGALFVWLAFHFKWFAELLKLLGK